MFFFAPFRVKVTPVVYNIANELVVSLDKRSKVFWCIVDDSDDDATKRLISI